MDPNKVIFVGADQVIRADLQELVDLDLHGAPYGYTLVGVTIMTWEGSGSGRQAIGVNSRMVDRIILGMF